MIKSVQSLRFVFILLVVFSHIYGKVFDFGGECGVSFFFMLSGFILSYAYGQRVADGTFSTRAFIAKQLTRLYPLHLLTFAVMVLLDARLGILYEWYRLLPNALLLQSWIPDDSFFFVANGSSWFLSDLLFFYLVFALAFRVLVSLSPKQLAAMAATVLLAYVVIAFSIPLRKVNAVLYASPLLRLIDFSIGILCCRLLASDWGQRFTRRLQTLSTTAMTLVEVLLIAGAVASFFVYEGMSLRLRCVALFWLYLPLLLVVYVGADKGRGVVTAIFHHPLMQWLGGVSFELYLTHYVVLRLWWSFLLSLGYSYEVRTTLTVIILTVILTIVVAWLTKRLFVEPVGWRLRTLIK